MTHPDQLTHLLTQGENALNQHRPAEAQTAFQQVLDLSLPHTPSHRRAVAGFVEASLHLGWMAERRRQFRAASRHYQAILHHRPGDPEAGFRLARLRRQRRRWWLGGVFISLITLFLLGGSWLWPHFKANSPLLISSLNVLAPTASPTAPTTLSPPTPTPTATATATPSPTASPTAQATATPSPTPTPILARARFEQVPYYPQASLSTAEGYLGVVSRAQTLHLCAAQGEFYLIALDDCHRTKALGWAKQDRLEPFNSQPFPTALTTPWPSRPNKPAKTLNEATPPPETKQ